VFKKKLKLPAPQRKSKIKTNIEENVFEIGDSFSGSYKANEKSLARS